MNDAKEDQTTFKTDSDWNQSQWDRGSMPKQAIFPILEEERSQVNMMPELAISVIIDEEKEEQEAQIKMLQEEKCALLSSQLQLQTDVNKLRKDNYDLISIQQNQQKEI